MNLAIRGIEGNIGERDADTFHNDQHRDLKADFILANPPFNISDWGGERLRDDVRWKHGTPPVSNANFGWVQHIVHHLAPTGIAGFVLANGSMSSDQSGEGEIRKAIIEADLVDCMIALPSQLFYTTQIPVCLWFLARDKKNNKFRDRRGHTLFIDARKLGHLTDTTHREFSDEDIVRISDTYHAWRGEKDLGEYKDIPGFCKNASTEDIRKHNYVLTPRSYIENETVVDDENWETKFMRLSGNLKEQFGKSFELQNLISQTLIGNHFKATEEGMLAHGWEVRSLDKIATFLNGIALQKYPATGQDSLPVIKIAQLRAGHTADADRASLDIPPEYIVEDGDLLFSWSGSLEVDFWCGGRGALNQHLFKVSSSEFPKWFCYLWILHHLPNFRAIAASKATTMGHIQRHHLSEAKVLVPPPDKLVEMEHLAKPIIDKIFNNRFETRTLNGIRDSLLLGLLSGQISNQNKS